MIEQFFTQKLTSISFLQIVNNQVQCELQVSFKRKQQPTHKIIFTKNYIFLKKISQTSHDQNLYALKIQFELNFQILSEFDKITQTNFGFVLFKYPSLTCTFYAQDQYSLNLVKRFLSKLIHQRDFHSQFTPNSKLGKGNFATVYEVLRLEDGKKFAVKAFSKKSTYSIQNGKQALKNQLHVMRQISGISKNLVSLEQIFQSDGSIYAVQQLLQGKSLDHVMKNRPDGLTYEQCHCVLKGLLEGIKSLNSKKFMHRDLKPENILFRTNQFTSPESYEPVIIDYGLCTRFDRWPYMFLKCGTPGYTAPQIMSLDGNSPYSEVCDMFSIGCLFHLILTGCSIFGPSSQQQLWFKNKSLQFDIQKKKVISCHPYALDLLQKLIQNIPSQRIKVENALSHEFFCIKSYSYQSKKSFPLSMETNQNTNKERKERSFINRLFSC